jgi:hypothetical protein
VRPVARAEPCAAHTGSAQHSAEPGCAVSQNSPEPGLEAEQLQPSLAAVVSAAAKRPRRGVLAPEAPAPAPAPPPKEGEGLPPAPVKVTSTVSPATQVTWPCR